MATAEDILHDIESRAKNENIPFIGPYKGQVLIDVIREEKPTTILEVGTNIGYSAILMAAALRVEGYKARLTTIEIDPVTAKIAEENIERSGFKDVISIILGDAKVVIPHLRNHFDLVFLDAVKNEYLDYLKAIEPKLSKRGVIVADNVGVFAKEMGNYLDYVRESGVYESQTYDFEYDAVEVSKKI